MGQSKYLDDLSARLTAIGENLGNQGGVPLVVIFAGFDDWMSPESPGVGLGMMTLDIRTAENLDQILRGALRQVPDVDRIGIVDDQGHVTATIDLGDMERRRAAELVDTPDSPDNRELDV